MTLTLIPDAEKITGKYLREHPAIIDLDARVVGKPPDSRETPWVQITQLDAPKETGSTPEHLISFMLQFDCYAGADGGQPEAALLGRTVRALLTVMPEAAHEGAVVTQARLLSHARIPDRDIEPARQRVILTADVRMHV